MLALTSTIHTSLGIMCIVPLVLEYIVYLGGLVLPPTFSMFSTTKCPYTIAHSFFGILVYCLYDLALRYLGILVSEDNLAYVILVLTILIKVYSLAFTSFSTNYLILKVLV